jgi:hypothetical protein
MKLLLDINLLAEPKAVGSLIARFERKAAHATNKNNTKII